MEEPQKLIQDEFRVRYEERIRNLNREQLMRQKRKLAKRQGIDIVQGLIISANKYENDRDEQMEFFDLKCQIQDGKKAYSFLIDEIGWDEEDVLHITEDLDAVQRIDTTVNRMLERSGFSDLTTLNIIFLHGHGILNSKNEQLFVYPNMEEVDPVTKEREEQIRFLNLDHLAQRFSDKKNTVTLIFASCSRQDFTQEQRDRFSEGYPYYNEDSRDQIPSRPFNKKGLAYILFGAQKGGIIQEREDESDSFEMLSQVLNEAVSCRDSHFSFFDVVSKIPDKTSFLSLGEQKWHFKDLLLSKKRRDQILQIIDLYNQEETQQIES